jgi:membrane protein required for colicin V production
MDFALILDLVVLTILVISSVVAFLRGFVREVLTILGLGGAALTALTVAPMLAGGLEAWLSEGKAEGDRLWGFAPYDIAAAVFSYAGVFVITLIIMSLISHWIAKSVHAIGLGPVDRTLGVVFGIVRALVLIGLLYMPFHLLMEEKDKQDWFGDSATIVYVEELSDITTALMPESLQSNDEEKDADPLGDLTGEDQKENDDIITLPDTGTDEQAADEDLINGYDAEARKAIKDLIDNNQNGSLNE